MRKLTIYRGEALISEVPLAGKPLRLGRSKDNEVVLEDPGKGVSRTHAELRPEGDGYRLVDLESQNGIWVSGERVPSVVLTPGVVAVMGPFRVAINAASPLTQPFTPITPDMLLPDTGTEFSRPIPPLPPVAPAATAVDGPGALLEDPSPATNPPPVAPAARPSASAPAAKPSSVAAAPGPPRPAGGASRPQPLIWAIVAAMLLGASAFGAYKLLYRAPAKPVWDATVAVNLANSGRCQEALDQQINPALQADPNNAEAQSLKQKCTAPPPTTSVPPTEVPPDPFVKTNAQKLDEADIQLAAKECQPALDAANAVLAADPNDARAKELAAKATTCLTPVGPRPPSLGDPVVKIAPADGGLEPLPGELGKDYKVRVNTMRKRFDDAVALLQVPRYAQALKEFDAIAGEVPQGYRDLAQRRAEARNGLREEAARAYASAQQAEQASQWNTAISRYQRAHDLDPARDVAADIARITEIKKKLGAQLCNEGKAAFSLGKNVDAGEKLTRVLELLQSDDPCYIEAKEILSKIRR